MNVIRSWFPAYSSGWVGRPPSHARANADGSRGEVRVTRTTVPHIRSGVGRVEDDLLRRYVVGGDLAAREELVARMRPIIRRLARRYRHTGYVEDLEQAAALGLTKALERFDPEFGTDFLRYAVPTRIG
jgi:DNA-directed RNA polymerase sigma subunit (sigma70/sigma32)